MAVYKPTYCQPFLTAVDIRTSIYNVMPSEANYILPQQLLSCKIDTSNKNITGYSIRIFNENNVQIFPKNVADPVKISPIDELPSAEDINTGVNGTYLSIPFFQNYACLVNKVGGIASYNALYYKVRYKADYAIFDTTAVSVEGATNANDLKNWTLVQKTDPDTGVLFDALQYNYNTNSNDNNNLSKLDLILLDDEPLQEGMIVATLGAPSSAASSKTGLWRVVKTISDDDQDVEFYLRSLAPFAVDDWVVILKGKTYHNVVWQCTSTTFVRASDSTPLWCDILGNDYSGIGVDDHHFKWDITLYQGTPQLVNAGPSTVPQPVSECIYNQLDFEWFDMTLTSGHVLGTTADRIQVSGILPGKGHIISGKIPISDGTTGHSLLQGTYMSLVGVPENEDVADTDFSASPRVYVKNYDATLGHIYPIKDKTNDNLISGATHAQFFKYSNNIDDLLETDIIKFGFNRNVSMQLYIYTDNKWEGPLQENSTTWMSSSVLNRYIVIESLNSLGVNVGDLILLANQTNGQQNGIYQYYQVHDKYCLRRPKQYSTWSSFIGRIFYIERGVTQTTSSNGDQPWGNRNIVSLATPGALTLWNPLQTKSGSNILLFGDERPLVLFGESITDNSVVDLFDINNPYPQDNKMTLNVPYLVDGQDVRMGDKILFIKKQISDTEYDSVNGYIGQVSGIEYSNSRYIYTLRLMTTVLSNSNFFFVNGGQEFGGRVFRWTSNKTNWSYRDADLSLTTVKILRNTTTRTYISPFKNIQSNMRIKLLNNQRISFQDKPDVLTSWIKINQINNTLFYIEHDALTEPLESYNPNLTRDPVRYEIRSFFKRSDSNPFMTYETPYVLLYKNNQLYSDISYSGANGEYMVQDTVGGSLVYNRFVPQDKTGNHEDFYIKMYQPQAILTGRSVTLGAIYRQFQQASWESYRWILMDSTSDGLPGKVLQDTGKKYDHNIETTFYGLTNEQNVASQYFAILYLDDDYHNKLVHIIKLKVGVGNVNSLLYGDNDGKFNAQLDCQNNAILLDYRDIFSGNNGAENQMRYSFYRREYEVYQRQANYKGWRRADNDDVTLVDFYTDDTFTQKLPRIPHAIYQDVGAVAYALYEYLPDTNQYQQVSSLNTYYGHWEPVLLKTQLTKFYDYNITNNRSYQYIIYPANDDSAMPGIDTIQQTFANFDQLVWEIDENNPKQGFLVEGSLYNTSFKTGAPVSTNWRYWSIVELEPQENILNAPIAKKIYKVNKEQIWKLKYDLEAGSQDQHVERNEIATLGQYPKFGFGKQNYLSGSISTLLGSELVPYTSTQYYERTINSRNRPRSTNESVHLLDQWRKFIYSPNPKLLRDTKGQSWIVQLTQSSNSPNTFWKNEPDKIRFDWVQIDDTQNVIIYDEWTQEHSDDTNSYGADVWQPYFKKK